MFNSLLGKIGMATLTIFFIVFGIYVNNGYVLLLGIIALFVAYFSIFKPKDKKK